MRFRQSHVCDVVLGRDARPGRRLRPQVPVEQIVELEYIPLKLVAPLEVDPANAELRVQGYPVSRLLEGRVHQPVCQALPHHVLLEFPYLVNRGSRGGKIDRPISE